MSLRAFSLFFVFSFVSLPIFAQEKMPLPAAVQLYLKNSPAIRSAESQMLSAAQLVNQAYAQALPKISLGGAATQQKVPAVLTGGFPVSQSEIYSLMLQFEQPLYTGGRVWNALKMRKAQSELARARYRAEKNKLLISFVGNYLEIYRLEKDLQIFLESQAVQKRFLDLAKKRGQRGNARSFEISQAEANFLSYAPRVRALQFDLSRLRQMINLDLNRPEDSAWQAELPLLGANPAANLSPAKLKEKSLESRADLKIKDLELELAEIQKKLNLGEHLPQVSLTGETGYQNPDRAQLMEDPSRAYRVTLGIQIPLFSGFSSIFTRRSDSELIRSVEYSKAQVLRDIDNELTSSSRAYSDAIQSLKDSQAWFQSADKAFREGERNFRLGLIDSFQVVQLQTGREAAALSLNRTQTGVHLARMNFRLAIGEDLDQDY